MGDTYTSIMFHIVFSTKERAALIKAHQELELYAYIGGIVRNKGSHLLAIGGMSDHVHVLVSVSPSTSVSDLVRVIKANSSRWMNEKRGILSCPFSWQSGYGAFSVSRRLENTIREYISNQKQHHRGTCFTDEYREMLKAHNINFEEEYLF